MRGTTIVLLRQFIKSSTCIIGSSRGPTPGSDRMDTGGACTPDLMGEKGNV